ncbi:MAG: hypothetical protein E7L09_05800 [Enterobacteriaceae bacterium]|nr:hypothetical protein [Enterobacteriaceae bacterium]
MEQMRSDFEKWFNDKATWKITASMRTKDGYVNNPSAQSKWEVWQASRAAIEIELPELEKWRSVEPVRAQIAYRALIKEQIIAAGLRVKEK